ncbi:2-oxoglutarate-dependent dioxygenase 33 (Melatonin 2-hydroxylase), partial [Durusdinium trenchii]
EQAQALDLVAALRSTGFVHVKDHGVPPQVTRDALDATVALFQGADAVKQEVLLRGAATQFRGYQAAAQNVTLGVSDQHEGFDMMRTFGQGCNVDKDSEPFRIINGRNLWPREPRGFQQAFERLVPHMLRLGHEIMGQISAGLREHDPPTVLNAKLFDDPFWICRALHYPVQAAAASQGVGAHSDYGLLTMIVQDDVPGCLQVLSADNEWFEVDPVPDCFVINVGDVLKSWTGGRLPATTHRVLSPTDRPRVSVPFFFEPNFDAPLKDDFLYRDHLLTKLRSNFDHERDDA